jgi:heat shock protein HtpX
MGNQLRTTLLLAVMTGLILWVGQLLGGRQGMVIALVLAAGMNFFSYWYSDKIVLRMYRAREITADQASDIYDIVRELCQRASLPMPKVCIVPQDAPNAFATGRNPDHAVVAVTQGLLQLMDREEIKGVIAHELAHVKNRDTLIGSIAATLAGAIMLLATMARWSAIFGGGGRSDEEGGGGWIGLIAMSIIAPLAAMVIQMAISRSREYLADATGARFAGSPRGLAQALEKLASHSKRMPLHASPSTAHMLIINPLSGGGMANLFSTHPPVKERIARLLGGEGMDRNDDGDVIETRQRRKTDAGRAVWNRLAGK